MNQKTAEQEVGDMNLHLALLPVMKYLEKIENMLVRQGDLLIQQEKSQNSFLIKHWEVKSELKSINERLSYTATREDIAARILD